MLSNKNKEFSNIIKVCIDLALWGVWLAGRLFFIKFKSLNNKSIELDLFF